MPRNTTTVTAYLFLIRKAKSSENGNPSFRLFTDAVPEYLRTAKDAGYAYALNPFNPYLDGPEVIIPTALITFTEGGTIIALELQGRVKCVSEKVRQYLEENHVNWRI